MEEYHQKTSADAKRRQELHEKELSDRRQHESLMVKLRDELEKEYLDKRQKVLQCSYNEVLTSNCNHS